MSSPQGGEVNFDKALLQSYIKMLKDMTRGGKDVSAAQIDHLQQMMKHMTGTINLTKEINNQAESEKRRFTFNEKELKTRERLKKLDDNLVKLRHKLNIDQEREHGEQVRRNINLRHNMDSFNDKFDMLKKSLTGGFGFQAAGDSFVKKMGGMTRSFQELEFANQSLADATKQKELKQDTVNQLKNHPDPEERKKAGDALKIAELAEERAKQGVKAAIKPAQGTQGKMTKPIFEKLGKLGDFLGKKAVPIGIGMGVAGVLMSVIVKAFSASPLFAAMMKMMKFMVTLILMPIGTFFGALLRPILIMLLRKFIIPFYSTMMPTLMNLGTQVGNAIVMFLDDPVKYLKDLVFPEETEEEKLERQNKEVEKLKEGIFGLDFLKSLGEILEKHLPKGGIFVPPIAEAFEEEKTEEDVSVPIEDPLHTSNLPTGDPNDTRTNEERLADDLDGKMIDTSPTTIPFDRTKENTQDDMFPWLQGGDKDEQKKGETQAEEDAREAEERRLRSEQQKQEWRDEQMKAQNEQNARMDKAREDEEKRLRQEENQKRLSEALAKPAASTGADRMAAQEARNAEQEKVENENTRFAGTPSEGKLSSSQNAGMNVGKTIDKNATKKHTMGSSQAGSDILREYWASRGVTMAAEGFDGMVNKPTMFMAGEAGSEHVKVTPNGQGGGSTITVNIQNMNAGDDDLRKLKKTILEVIQQSANNRGRI